MFFFIDFVNKGLDFIKISSILHDQDVIDSLPDNLKIDEVPSVVYRVTKTILNKILTINKLLLILILMIMILSALDWVLANVKIHLILTLIMVT